MKFLIVFLFFVVACVAAAPSKHFNNIRSVVKNRSHQSYRAMVPPQRLIFPQHRYVPPVKPNKNNFVHRISGFFSKFTTRVPKWAMCYGWKKYVADSWDEIINMKYTKLNEMFRIILKNKNKNKNKYKTKQKINLNFFSIFLWGMSLVRLLHR